jgi:hypothetical protein
MASLGQRGHHSIREGRAMSSTYVSAFFGLCLALSISDSAAQGKPPVPKTTAERIKELEDKVGFLQAISDVDGRRFRPSFADLDCETKRFGSVQSDDPARFLIMVSCTNIEPYLEGYRITLNVANPYSMHMTLVKGTLLYGPYPKKKAEIPLTQGLSPGQWTRTSVSISQAQAAEMRNLQAEFYVEQLSARDR